MKSRSPFGSGQTRPPAKRADRGTPKLRIDVWADVACPFCWVGKRRLETAVAASPERARIEVVWRAFELDPHPRADGTPYATRLANEYGAPLEEVSRRLAELRAIAAGEGIELRFDQIRPARTFDAHRVLCLARDCHVQDAVCERFFRGCMTDGELLSDHDTLVRLGRAAGLDPEIVRRTLANDIYDDEVREDEEQAVALGVRAVPFFLIDGRYTIAGAEPASVLAWVMSRAFSAGAPPTAARR